MPRQKYKSAVKEHSRYSCAFDADSWLPSYLVHKLYLADLPQSMFDCTKNVASAEMGCMRSV